MWKIAGLGLRKREDLGRQNWAAHPTKNSEGYPSELQTPAAHVDVVEEFTGNAFSEMLYFQQVLIVK